MKLYAHRYCPFCRRVRIALVEKSIEDVEYVELDPRAEHPREILGKTPSRTGVPVLAVKDDFVIWDSTAIMGWLDRAYPASLTPGAMDVMALADSWTAWTSTKLYPAMRCLTPGSPAAGAAKAEECRASESKLLSALRDAAHLFPEGDAWMIGSVFSYADVAMAPALAVLDETWRAKMPDRVRAYAERLRARESIRHVCEIDLARGDRPSKAA
jgi:glutathione S-transferase